MNGILPSTYVPGFHDEEAVKEMRYSRLGHTDMLVSNFGLGGTPFGHMYGDMGNEEIPKICTAALKSGVNFIDTSPWYRSSQENIGKVLAQQGIPRKAFYIATKVGRYPLEQENMFNFTRNQILESVNNSLNLLGVDYIDLIQVHDVEFCASLAQIVDVTIPALVELKKAGKCRYIGITGYDIGVLRRIVSMVPPNTIDTVLSYCRYNLLNRDLEDSFAFFSERGVGIINASPVAMGLLTVNAAPDWHPAIPITKRTCEEAGKYCQSKGFSLPDLAVKWCFQQRVPSTTLCGIMTMKQLQLNVTAASNDITKEESALLLDLEDKFFRRLVTTHWENLEVVEYWKHMEEGGHGQSLDV